MEGQPEQIVANAPDDPCQDTALTAVANSLLTFGGLRALAQSRSMFTDQRPDDVASTQPVVGDRSFASVQTTRAFIGPIDVATSSTVTEATAECTRGALRRRSRARRRSSACGSAARATVT